ncbi:helix-turn-helix domain-containing protein [Ekhidna sp.]|uniref:helix-turn-helix domain-containing protein n=1 Tax=Ekhidna sp. TaxID=2608089 RepID=UPI003CCB7644
MPLFNTYQLIIFLGLINGFILLITLSGLPGRFRRPGRFLGFFVLGYSIYVANWTVIPSITAHYDVPPLWIPSLYFLPTLAYFFAQSITRGNEAFTFRDKLFFIPGVADTIYQLYKWVTALIEGGGYYFPLDDRQEFFIYEGIGIVLSAFCFSQIYLLVRKSQLKQNATYRFYQFAFYFLIFVLFRWMCLYAVDFFMPSLLSFELQFVFWLMDLSCFFILGYRNLMAPNKYSNKLPTLSKNGGNSHPLLTLLHDKKLYTNSELSRRDLADLMGVSEEKISRVLSEELDVTFYNLINKLRVNESKRLLDDGVADKLTMEAIANQSGFKSKTTFYKFFKNEFGVKPSEYARNTSSLQ